ncbi:MAG: hypothetical protein WDN44_02060 [Sphingomonas sp.]
MPTPMTDPSSLHHEGDRHAEPLAQVDQRGFDRPPIARRHRRARKPKSRCEQLLAAPPSCAVRWSHSRSNTVPLATSSLCTCRVALRSTIANNITDTHSIAAPNSPA